MCSTEFDLYESLRLGRFVYNTPEKARTVVEDQRAVEAREAEELRTVREAAALRIQALNRGNQAREQARQLKMQKMAESRDLRSSHSSRSKRSGRVPSRPPTATIDDNMPQTPWDLFCTWCAGGDAQDTKKAKTMDYKEWVHLKQILSVLHSKYKISNS